MVRETSICHLRHVAVALGCFGSSATSTAPAQSQVTVAGPAQVRLGTTIQLTAAVTNTANAALTWQVDGVAGRAGSTGTISTAGLYTPPSVIPVTNTVTVTAISQATPAVSAIELQGGGAVLLQDEAAAAGYRS